MTLQLQPAQTHPHAAPGTVRPSRQASPVAPAASVDPIPLAQTTGNPGGEVPAGVVLTTIPIAPATVAPVSDGPAYVEQIDRILPLLSRWTGGMATLWTYTISHGKLVLRFTRPNTRGNLHVVCYDCRRIGAPTFWGGTNVQVTEEATPEGRRYVLRDDAANVEIRCGHLAAAENVEPVY